MKYVRISRKYCFCIYEPINKEIIDNYFRVGKVVFVKNSFEKIVGIISFSDYEKGIKKGKNYINRTFKSIILYDGCMQEVNRFFDETGYYSLPVLNMQGELVECFFRIETPSKIEIFADKWLDIANVHLAKLVKKKGYNKIKICMTNSLSEKLYAYFKHYELYFSFVEKLLWYSAFETREDEIVIANDKMDMLLNITTYSYDSLRMELEYNLLLYNCKQKDVQLYIVSVPNSANVWNVTPEEHERMRYGGTWKRYMENRQSYKGLLAEVLERKDDLNEFIDSCLNLPPVIKKISYIMNVNI